MLKKIFTSIKLFLEALFVKFVTERAIKHLLKNRKKKHK